MKPSLKHVSSKPITTSYDPAERPKSRCFSSIFKPFQGGFGNRIVALFRQIPKKSKTSAQKIVAALGYVSHSKGWNTA
jgi:hypothetical protein